MMHISNSGSLQQSADGYQHHADMMRVQQHRRHDAVFDQWAQGCGVIEHTAATQLAVFELAANLEETGMIAEDGGEHLMVFFSEDKARNLEVIQSTELRIDTTAPIIIMNEKKLITRINGDVYRSD